MTDQRRVVFLAQVVTHYRVPFHELMRANLARAGVRYELISGVPRGAELKKGDTIDLDWVTRVPEVALGVGHRRLLYHPIASRLRGADLVILMQENKHLLNYLIQLLPRGLRPKIAMMGHGRNFQSRNRDSVAERWKRFWATKVDWWFGYTEETKRHVASLGFSADQITVFNNAVDTSEVRQLIAAATPARLAARRAELGLTGDAVGVFVGGLYEDKRLAFLVDAADRVRTRVPTFELVVAGGGEQLPLMRELAATRPWIKVTGPRFGADKVELMLLGRLFLMPGLVGLAVVDAGAAGLPTVTTAFPYHSPEIAYVEHDVNGVVVADWENPAAYADAVAGLLEDPARLAAMQAAARRMAEGLTIEAMAQRFADGVIQALAA